MLIVNSGKHIIIKNKNTVLICHKNPLVKIANQLDKIMSSILKKVIKGSSVGLRTMSMKKTKSLVNNEV